MHTPDNKKPAEPTGIARVRPVWQLPSARSSLLQHHRWAGLPAPPPRRARGLRHNDQFLESCRLLAWIDDQGAAALRPCSLGLGERICRFRWHIVFIVLR